MQRHLIWLAGLLALASASALAAPPAASRAAPIPGAVASAWETIVEVEPDGTRITTSRPIKDIAAWFESMGAPVPPIAPQTPGCSQTANDTTGHDGRGQADDNDGKNGHHQPPIVPQQHLDTANGMEPPPNLPQIVVSYFMATDFSDGWNVATTWARAPITGHPAWQRQSLTWTPPARASDTESSTAPDCKSEQE